MPRVTRVAKAQKRKEGKPDRTCGKCRATINVGEPYVWWASRLPGMRSGIKYYRCSKPECFPKPYELLHGFAADVSRMDHAAGEGFAGLSKANAGVEDYAAYLEELAGNIRELGEEQREKLENMPEGLQQGDTGQLLESRADGCEEKAEEWESAADSARSRWESESVDTADVDAVKEWATEQGHELDEGETEEDFIARMIEECESEMNDLRNELIQEMENLVEFMLD